MIIYNKILNLSFILEKLAKSKPLIMFHGTSKDRLNNILSSGLLSNPKSRAWQNDEDASYFSPSRQSLEGVYLTNNLMTAISAANNNRKNRNNPVIVVVKVQLNTLNLDEDELSLSFSAPNSSEYYNFLYYLYSIYDKQQFKNLIQPFRDALIERVKLKVDNIHPEFQKRIDEIVFDIAKASITRYVSHIDSYNYKMFWDRDGEFLTGKKEILPQPEISKSEQEFKKQQDIATRALRKIIKVSDPDDIYGIPNVRLLDNVGYSGGNKIVMIFEIDRNEDKLILIYPNNMSEIENDVIDKVNSSLKHYSSTLKF